MLRRTEYPGNPQEDIPARLVMIAPGVAGHPKHQADPGREATNVRNGSRSKTVISDAAGEMVIDVPRDREGTFEPQIVRNDSGG